MKKFLSLFSTCLFIFGIISCSNLQSENASLVLTFNSSDFIRDSSARNIEVSSDYKGYYIVASILGDYTETKNLQISNSGSYELEFPAVPVGADIYVEANVFNPNLEGMIGGDFPAVLHLFTGKSSQQTITPGTNSITLTMKNLQNEFPNFDYRFNTTEGGPERDYSSTYKGVPIWNSAQLLFYKNGKYLIRDGNNQVISEGLFTGTPERGNSIHIKEYIYKKVSNFTELNGAGDVYFGNPVLAENPDDQEIYLTEAPFKLVTGSDIVFYFE